MAERLKLNQLKSNQLQPNQVSVKTFNKLAQRYQDKYMDLAMYIDTFEPFIKALPRLNARVLELACGPGNITCYLLTHRPELSILATDLAPNMLTLAQQNNPQVEVALLDSRALRCDYVWLLFTLSNSARGFSVNLRCGAMPYC